LDAASGVVKAKAGRVPFDRNGAEAGTARPSRAVLAAETGAIRADLWAEAAFTGARFREIDRSTGLKRTNSGQLARARANAETALLASWRLEREATSGALADMGLQAFIKSDIRGIGQQR
jgi:hypothetical protein